MLETDPYVYLHYTDDRGLKQIHAEGVIRMNSKYSVYFSREPLDPAMANICLFLSATTHVDRGSHLLVVRLDPGIPLEMTGPLEFRSRQSIRLIQNEVLYAGLNPF
jgi:hypothetical protein